MSRERANHFQLHFHLGKTGRKIKIKTKYRTGQIGMFNQIDGQTAQHQNSHYEKNTFKFFQKFKTKVILTVKYSMPILCMVRSNSNTVRPYYVRLDRTRGELLLDPTTTVVMIRCT